MAINLYFNNFNSNAEQTLIENLIVESIKQYGIDVYYLPRTLVSEDDLLNEDDLSVFNQAISIEMYIKNIEGFDGDGDLLSKFGMEIRDSMTMTVAKKVFDETFTQYKRPLEGDLLFFPLNNKIYEIMFVEREAIFYQMGRLQTYDLKLELFEYSKEEFSTNNVIIDSKFEDRLFDPNVDLDDFDPFADNKYIQDEANNFVLTNEESILVNKS